MSSYTVDMLRTSAARGLVALGINLSVARKRRGESLPSFAERLRVSVPRFRKWKKARVQFLGAIADPVADETALMLELRNLAGGKAKK
jgi:hypothetical protein